MAATKKINATSSLTSDNLVFVNLFLFQFTFFLDLKQTETLPDCTWVGFF